MPPPPTTPLTHVSRIVRPPLQLLPLAAPPRADPSLVFVRQHASANEQLGKDWYDYGERIRRCSLHGVGREMGADAGRASTDLQIP
jgi:hypothetical protein